MCEIFAQWTEEFAPWFPSCEIVPQLDAVVFRRPYLPHFSSKSYMVWIVGFLTFWALKWYVERKKWTSGSAPKVQWKTAAVSPVFITLFSSSPLFSPCILWTTKAKDYEAPKLGFFINLSFPKALPWTIYSSPSFINCFGEHKAIKKHQNSTQLLETIARVPNMLIELKGNNYYSRLFKRANYKLQNSMFWLVIICTPLIVVVMGPSSSNVILE